MAREFKGTTGKDLKGKKPFGERKGRKPNFDKKPYQKRGEDSDSSDHGLRILFTFHVSRSPLL